MSADILLTHFNQLFCPNDLGHPLYGKEMAEAKILSDAYIAIKDGKILAVGTGQPDPELIDDHTEVKSCEGKVSGCFVLRHPRPRRWNSEHGSGDAGSFF